MTLSLRSLLGATALFAGAASAADEPVRPPQVATCQVCHGRGGISEAADIPNLAGQKKGYLAAQLAAFKRGERKNELMAAVAGQLSDADMQALALYWSQLSGPAAGARAAVAAADSTAIRSRMAFPAGFPSGFAVYETLASAEDGTVTLRYANGVALQAARAGQPLPAGSVLMVATHAALPGAGAALVPGKVTSYAGMETRAGWGASVPALLRNGDWDYAIFGADGTRRDSVNQAPCLACHQPLAASSHVFTLPALREAATQAAR